MDDGIRERHGMEARLHGYAERRPITLKEGERDMTLLNTRDDIDITPAQARYLARQLYRLARRIEARNG